jgi:hypothetical protein
LIASVWEGVGLDDVLLVIEVELSDIELDDEVLSEELSELDGHEVLRCVLDELDEEPPLP